MNAKIYYNYIVECFWHHTLKIIIIFVAPLAVTSCQNKDVGVYDRPCQNGQCIEGFICRPFDNICVPKVKSVDGSCSPVGAFLPCIDGDDLCEHGCRICESNGSWSKCQAPTCGELGTPENCSVCGDNCVAKVKNAESICVGNEANTAFFCDYNSEVGCKDSYVDLDTLHSNGCECLAAATESCDGLDNDCDGVVPDNEIDHDGDGYVQCITWTGNDPKINGGGDCMPYNQYIHPNAATGSGCSKNDGWSCIYNGAACTPICGDNILLSVEKCEDNNDQSGDGCYQCQVEDGWICSAINDCKPNCGDGKIIADEKCDVGNYTTEGCVDCQVVSGWACGGEPSFCNPLRKCALGDLTVDANNTDNNPLPVKSIKVIEANPSDDGFYTVVNVTWNDKAAATDFSPNDVVLLITMVHKYNTTESNLAGQWEVHEIKAVSGNTITLKDPPRNSYPNGVAYAHQLVKFQEHKNVLIEEGVQLVAPAWDSSLKIGGVLALSANTITLGNGAQINMSTSGFSGGVAGGAYGPETYRGKLTIGTDGNGGKGGQASDSSIIYDYAKNSPYAGESPVGTGAGGGASGGYLQAAEGFCGGGGGGGGGGCGSMNCTTPSEILGAGAGGKGAGNGGNGFYGGGIWRQEGAGGGGCPVSPKGAPIENEAKRLLFGTGSAAGASGGCSASKDYHTETTSDASYKSYWGYGGAGGLSNGGSPDNIYLVGDQEPKLKGDKNGDYVDIIYYTNCETAGEDGAAGGGIIFLIANSITVAENGQATIISKGGDGGKGGNGQSGRAIDAKRDCWEGYGGGGGGAGAAGAGGGTVIILSNQTLSNLNISVSGGEGGNGGAGGAGSCPQWSEQKVTVINGGASGGVVGGSATQAFEKNESAFMACGGGGGGGANGQPGTHGRIFVPNGIGVTQNSEQGIYTLPSAADARRFVCYQ
ncbi:MAG: DUF4215 domain-containing protein [Deltaproteobacteria bacterium]|nr:DUF4215 domain-containing protein [Deltaproteobacteria bacterium]